MKKTRNKAIPKIFNFERILFRAVVILGDGCSIMLAYFCAYFIRFNLPQFHNFFPVVKGIPPIGQYEVVLPFIFVVWIIALNWLGCYNRINYPAIDEIIRLVQAGFLGTILSMSTMFLYRESSFSRIVFLMGGGLSIVLIYIFRQIVKSGYVFWIRTNGRPNRVFIIGSGALSKSLQTILSKQGDRAVLLSKDLDPEKIRKSIIRSRISEVLVANSSFSHNNAVTLANFCEHRGVSFRIIPDILELRMGEIVIDDSLGVPTFRIRPVSLHGASFLAKRFMDLMCSLLFIILFFIPLIAVGVLIKLTSKGPIFYRQKRMGYHGNDFEFLKFRTMVINADELLEDLKAKSDRGGHVFKMKKDPRVTSIGHFLRRYSIDELPQIINVLRGEMSLVGPRPQVLWETEAYDDWARKRLNVLPGITGLWQVSGRAELTFEEMIELDIYYIEHWSPGLDIKIILKTIPAVLFGKGAY